MSQLPLKATTSKIFLNEEFLPHKMAEKNTKVLPFFTLIYFSFIFRYLEHVLSTLTDPYDLAVVTWALFKSNSIENDYAFNALDQMKRVAGIDFTHVFKLLSKS